MHLELERKYDWGTEDICALYCSTDQLGVNVEVDSVAGLVAPGGGVQGGADVELVT